MARFEAGQEIRRWVAQQETGRLQFLSSSYSRWSSIPGGVAVGLIAWAVIADIPLIARIIWIAAVALTLVPLTALVWWICSLAKRERWRRRDRPLRFSDLHGPEPG